jgi:K+-sensing histidine kinase KdpD
MRIPSPRFLKAIDIAIGTLLCASAALLLALLFNETRIELVLPLICLTIVLAVASRFGALTGALGSIACAALLAWFVYTPEHSFHIVNQTAKASISWLLLGGISLSFLFGPPRAQERAEKPKER